MTPGILTTVYYYSTNGRAAAAAALQGGLSFESLTWEFLYQPFAHPALDTVSFAASYAGTFIFVGIMSGALSMVRPYYGPIAPLVLWTCYDLISTQH